MDAGAAAAILGGGGPPAEEAVTETEDGSLVDSTESVDSDAHEASVQTEEDSDISQGKPTSTHGGALPQVNCSFCDSTLEKTDQWAECESCGAYCHEQCKSGQQICPRCGTRL